MLLHKYQPQVSPLGWCFRPLIGNLAGSKSRAMPSLRLGSTHEGIAPHSLHNVSCTFRMFIADSPSLAAVRYRFGCQEFQFEVHLGIILSGKNFCDLESRRNADPTGASKHTMMSGL